MEEAEALCDRVAFMNAGQIVGLDTPAGLIRSLRAPYRVMAASDRPLPEAALRSLPGATEVEVSGEGVSSVVRLRAQDASAATTALTALAARENARLTDLAVRPASLEDVFLSVTGRTLSG